MFKEYYKQYTQSYEAELTTSNLEAEQVRKKIQGELSWLIAKDFENPDIKAYVNNVQLPPADTRERKISWLPHIDEAVYSTLTLRRLAKDVNSEISKISKVNAMYGSGAWGAYYSTHRSSDLNLEVIVYDLSPEIANLKVFSGYNDKLREALQLTIDRDIDILLFEIPYNGTPLMYHFISAAKFNHLIGKINLANTQNRSGFRQLMNNFHGVLDYTDRCSFSDERRNWHAVHEQVTADLHLLELPIYQVENGKIFNGLFTEWHLTPPFVVGGDVGWFEYNCSIIFTEFVKRWIIEEETQGKQFRFSNILERKHRMPTWLLNELDRNAEKIRMQLNL